MKKLIFGCAALVSALVLNAAVESGNTFGILKIENDQEQVIISVPWVKVGTGGAISPTNLVCTTGLAAGDKLYYYDSSVEKYYGWKVKDSSGTLVWDAEVIAAEGEDGVYKDTANKTVARGTDALILERPGTRSAFYLNGQYNNTSGSSTIRLGTTTMWSFFAPSTAADVYLNKNGGGSTVVANDEIYDSECSTRPFVGDVIRFSGDKKFTYKDGRWEYTRNVATTFSDPVMGEITVYNPETTSDVDKVFLPAGVAAIYISAPRANEDSIVYKW